ncbi:hypothetical protein ACRRTK_023919 [Alexandromys fortis]
MAPLPRESNRMKKENAVLPFFFFFLFVVLVSSGLKIFRLMDPWTGNIRSSHRVKPFLTWAHSAEPK